MIDGEINFDIYNDVNNMNYENCIDILNTFVNNINNDNFSVIKTIKE